MELNDAQKQTVAEWVARGDDIAAVQKLIESEFGIKMTYMDVRFLLLDLNVTLKDKPTSQASDQVVAESGADAAGAAFDGGSDMPAATGAVRVSLDKVVQPGAVVSGSVTFSDGVSATWMLDQMGRLALNAATPGYRPSESDLQEFQNALRNELQKSGF